MNTDFSPISLLQLHTSTRGLSDDEIAEIADKCEVVRCGESDVLLQPDQPIDSLYLICAGHLSISVTVVGGNDKTISFAARDDQIGILSILQDDEDLQLRVVAEQPSILLKIPRADAFELLESIPLWAKSLLRALGPKMRDSILGARDRERKRVVSFIHMTERTCGLTNPLVRSVM